MPSSSIYNLMVFGIFILANGCQTAKKFEINNLNGDLHTVQVRRDRIRHECHFMNADKENQWRHQYILYMLTEKNEVIPVFYPINQDKDQCNVQLKTVDRILKNGGNLKLCVRDKLERVTNTSAALEYHDFGPLGKYETAYGALTFDTICNSETCFSISDTWTSTCPGFKFESVPKNRTR